MDYSFTAMILVIACVALTATGWLLLLWRVLDLERGHRSQQDQLWKLQNTNHKILSDIILKEVDFLVRKELEKKNEVPTSTVEMVNTANTKADEIVNTIETVIAKTTSANIAPLMIGDYVRGTWPNSSKYEVIAAYGRWSGVIDSNYDQTPRWYPNKNLRLWSNGDDERSSVVPSDQEGQEDRADTGEPGSV